MGEVEGPMLKLTMEKGPLAGQTVEFKPGITVRVGRVVRGNNLTIKDSGISSKHLTIEFNSSDGKWVLRDLGSSNGTVLNADKLEPSCPSCLADCDVIKIGELTSIKVQIEDTNRATTKPRRNGGRKAATANDGGDEAENCELGLVGEDANRAPTKPRRNASRKAAIDATTNDGGDAAENCELGLVGEDANRASSKPRRNPRRKAAADTTTSDDGGAAENCELGLVGEELGNNDKGKTRRPPRPRTRAKTQAQRDSESVKDELQPEGIGLENAGLRMTRSSSKTQNFDGGDSQVETGDVKIVESLGLTETTAQYADENGDQRRTRNARGRGCRELRNLVPIEQPQAKAKRSTRSKKQINLQAESVTTVHLEEEEGAAKMSISEEHTQCKVEAIQSREEERQVEGYDTVVEPVNFGEGHNSISNASGAKQDKNEVWEQTKCQDEATQSMEEDGQEEENRTVEEQQTFEEEICHGLLNVSGGSKGKPDVGEVNLENLTLGEWLDYLETNLPKQIIDVTEEMISEMRKKAERLQEFMLHQKNA